jgi:ribosomal protein S18 acetylase RimI-like enzyme
LEAELFGRAKGQINKSEMQINKSEIEIPKSEITIEQITPELTWRLRRDVLYPGKKMFEMEMEEDKDGIHFGAFRDDQLAGVVSLFQTGSEFQFRKLAVDPSIQKSGIGSSLLNYITLYAQENGGTKIWCNARIEAIGFYVKAGFMHTSKLFSRNHIDYEILEKEITPPSAH